MKVCLFENISVFNDKEIEKMRVADNIARKILGIAHK